MDADWKGKVVKRYYKDGVDTDAMRKAAQLDITPDATIATDEFHVFVTMPFLYGYEPFRQVTEEQKQQIHEYLAEHGLMANDLHAWNIMWDPDTGDVKVIDYEQFRDIRYPHRYR